VLPERFPAGDPIDRCPQIEKTRQDASSISLDDRDWPIEGEGSEGVRRIFPDSRKFPDLVSRLWTVSTMSVNDYFSGSMKVSGASVVTEALPGVEDVTFRGARKREEIWEAAEPLFIIRDNRGNLGLLEHYLGDEDGVRIARLAPGKVAAVAAIPAEKRAAERANVFWGCHDLKANVQRPTLNVQLSIQKIIEH
jgi:hypothetical protein